MKNAFAKMIFGMTKVEAHEAGICLSCKKVIDSKLLSSTDIKEYDISGLCPDCFLRITGI